MRLAMGWMLLSILPFLCAACAEDDGAGGTDAGTGADADADTDADADADVDAGGEDAGSADEVRLLSNASAYFLYSVSSNGKYAVIGSGAETAFFLWDLQADSVTELTGGVVEAMDVTDDGVVYGSLDGAPSYYDGAWHAIALPADTDINAGTVNDVSADGSLYCGISYNRDTWSPFSPTKWEGGVPAILPTQEGAPYGGRVDRMSADGSVLVGYSPDTDYVWHASIWVDGAQRIVDGDEAWGVSEGARYVVGTSDNSYGLGFLYDLETEERTEIDDPESTGLGILANVVTDDGAVLASQAGQGNPTERKAFVWRKAGDATWLADFLVERYGFTGFSEAFPTFTGTVMSASSDFRTIGGFGTDATGNLVPWVLVFAEPIDL